MKNYKFTKYIYFLSTVILILINFSCNSSQIENDNKERNIRDSKYFRVDVRIDDNWIFEKLLKDLEIDTTNKIWSYQIIVDVRSKDTTINYIRFDDNYETKVFSWYKLSEVVRKGLFKWAGTNKEACDFNYGIH